jgi:Ran-binding protein 3
MFSCRAKLLHFEKEWKERGVGTVKLNIHYSIKEDPDEAPEQKARLIMRTDGVHRVVLNTPVFKGMRFGTPDGKEPNGKTLNLTGMENGKPALFLLRVSLLFDAKSCVQDKADEFPDREGGCGQRTLSQNPNPS